MPPSNYQPIEHHNPVADVTSATSTSSQYKPFKKDSGREFDEQNDDFEWVSSDDEEEEEEDSDGMMVVVNEVTGHGASDDGGDKGSSRDRKDIMTNASLGALDIDAAFDDQIHGPKSGISMTAGKSFSQVEDSYGPMDTEEFENPESRHQSYGTNKTSDRDRHQPSGHSLPNADYEIRLSDDEDRESYTASANKSHNLGGYSETDYESERFETDEMPDTASYMDDTLNSSMYSAVQNARRYNANDDDTIYSEDENLLTNSQVYSNDGFYEVAPPRRLHRVEESDSMVPI